MLEEREGVHPASADEAWQESVFLAWRDPVRRIGGIHRIGTEANRGKSNMWCGVFQEGGAWFRLIDEGQPFGSHAEGSGFRSGPQHSFVKDGSLRWSLDSADCTLQLSIEDLASGDLWVANTESMARVSVTGHYHHHCRVRGQVRLAGESIRIDGFGWRDHSWGVRHWDAILHHRCFSASFGDNHAIDFYSLIDAQGSLSRGGVVVRDGRKEIIEDFRFTVALEDDGLTARSADVRGRYPSGEPFAAHFNLTGAAVVQTREYLGIESVGEIALASGEKGFGYVAVSTNPRSGRGVPPLVLAAVGKNGLTRDPL
jgi:hypothetical protein